MSSRMRSRRKSAVNNLLGKLAAEEQSFLSREFLAPALAGGEVRVRIGGAVCRIRIAPADFVGWGVFQPVSHSEAVLAREASLAERRSYLDLFPALRLIASRRARGTWFGSAASFGDSRLKLEGLAPIALATEVQAFDGLVCRFDGTRFWFDALDPRSSPATAAYLRQAFHARTAPNELARPGLTAEARAAYEISYWELVGHPEDDKAPRSNPPHKRRGRNADRSREFRDDGDATARRLRASLSHAGAELVDYLERGDSFRVRYTVGGQHYTSSVNKDDLTVQVAGICLSGQDRKFDLASMVGVLRESGGGVTRVGDEHGFSEEDYWDVHPTEA